MVISSSTRRRIVFVPFYIHRTQGAELAIKVVTYVRDQNLPWVEKEERSLSLDHAAAHRLLAALERRLALEGHQKDGHYLVIRVTDGVADVAALDSASIAKAVAGLLQKKDIVAHLSSKELGVELLHGLRVAIRLHELRAAVSQLRQNLDAGTVDEQVYQAWCERHSWAFGNAHVLRDSIRTISAGDRVDLLLPSVMGGFRDLVELKRPNMEVLNFDSSHRNYFWAADTAKAIGQCHRYLDVLHEQAGKGLLDHEEIVAYHPRATIVIGRSHDWAEDKVKALHGLNRRLTGISVMTYDQLLAQGERLVEVASAEEPAAGEGPTRDEDDLPGF